MNEIRYIEKEITYEVDVAIPAGMQKLMDEEFLACENEDDLDRFRAKWTKYIREKINQEAYKKYGEALL